MNQQAYRNMIVLADQVQLARGICSTLAPTGGAAMFSVGLSATGLPPATHYVSTGHLDAEFAALMPLLEYQQDQDGVYQATVISVGSPNVVAALCQDKGFEITEAQVQEVFDASDVTLEDPFTSFARLGLMLVNAEDPQEV